MRQGSVLSPSLFNVYLDDLIVRLEKSGEGARLHGLFVGCLVYADDITLLSPTVSGLQNMQDICYSFTQDHQLKFNGKKSSAIVFVKKKYSYISHPIFKLGDCDLQCHSTIRDLGVELQASYQDTLTTVKKRIQKYYGTVHSIISRLGGYCTSDKVWAKIIDVQLFPVVTYGSQLWDISKVSVIKSINTAYRKGIRRGLGMAQSDSIRGRMSDWFEECEVKVRRQQLLYMKRAAHSVNSLVRRLGWLLLRDKCTWIRSILDMNVFAWPYTALKEYLK